MQIIFLSGTKCLRLPQYVNKFLVWHKKFGPAQNILGPVKGQGIRQCDEKKLELLNFLVLTHYILFFLHVWRMIYNSISIIDQSQKYWHFSVRYKSQRTVLLHAYAKFEKPFFQITARCQCF